MSSREYPGTSNYEDENSPSSGTGNSNEDEPDSSAAGYNAPDTFTATINVGYMQRFLDAIRTVTDECKIHLEPSGMTIHASNPAKTILTTAEFGKDAFETYDTNGDSGSVVVSVKRLREIVRVSSNRDLMHFTLDEDGKTLQTRVGSLKCSVQTLGEALVNSENGPEANDYTSIVVLEGGELKRIMKAAGYVSDMLNLRVEWTSDRFVAEASGESDSFRAPRDPDDLIELFSGNEPAGSTFNLGYLKDVKRAIRKRTEVTLAIGTDLPLSVEFDIADGAGHVEYGIAPVVEAN